MLEIVQLPIARRLWKISKLLHLPVSHPAMQSLDTYDLDFYELSDIADDPKKLEQLQNRFFDPDFDEWLEEFDKEQSEKQVKEKESTEPEPPDLDTIKYSQNNSSNNQVTELETEEYEMGTAAANEEFERDDE